MHHHIYVFLGLLSLLHQPQGMQTRLKMAQEGIQEEEKAMAGAGKKEEVTELVVEKFFHYDRQTLVLNEEQQRKDLDRLMEIEREAWDFNPETEHMSMKYILKYGLQGENHAAWLRENEDKRNPDTGAFDVLDPINATGYYVARDGETIVGFIAAITWGRGVRGPMSDLQADLTGFNKIGEDDYTLFFWAWGADPNANFSTDAIYLAIFDYINENYSAQHMWTGIPKTVPEERIVSGKNPLYKFMLDRKFQMKQTDIYSASYGDEDQPRAYTHSIVFKHPPKNNRHFNQFLKDLCKVKSTIYKDGVTLNQIFEALKNLRELGTRVPKGHSYIYQESRYEQVRQEAQQQHFNSVQKIINGDEATAASANMILDHLTHVEKELPRFWEENEEEYMECRDCADDLLECFALSKQVSTAAEEEER